MSLSEQRGMTDERIVQAYKYAGNIRKAAQVLRISRDSVGRVLKERGVSKPAGGSFKKGHYYPSLHTGCFAEYLKRHPNVKLPRSSKAMAYITGCSVDAVKSYLYRMRRFERRRAKALPDLRTLPIALVSRGGDPFLTSDCERYDLRVDDYDFRYLITLHYGKARVRAKVSRDTLLSLIELAKMRKRSEER